jgi:outer membrane protein OmpA-like peptidoglycan-associated protein
MDFMNIGFRQYELAPEFEFILNESETGTNRNTREYIKWVQASLNQVLGLYLAVDGVMGANTRSAIRSFQKQNGLSADGVVGANTEKAIGAAVAKGSPALSVSSMQCDIIDEFDFDSFILKLSHEPMLVKAAKAIIASLKTATPVRKVELVGHTDKSGREKYNEGLGQQRADNTKKYFIELIEWLQPGASSGIVFNATSKGEKEAKFSIPAKNRRVEICYPKVPVSPTPVPTPVVPADPCATFTPNTTLPVPEIIKQVIIAIKAIAGQFPLLSLTGVVFPTTVRFLDKREQGEACKIYHRSLDFSRILIANGVGFSGREFTIAQSFSGTPYVILMVGSGFSDGTLIHELAHAWQSQHHGSNPKAVMFNSIACQIAAFKDIPNAKAAAAGAVYLRRGLNLYDPKTIALAAEAFANETVSAYDYVPGKPFEQYAAEQIAQQVEDFFIEQAKDFYLKRVTPVPSIVTTIRSVAPNARSIPNEMSLSVVRFERSSTPKVVLHP